MAKASKKLTIVSLLVLPAILGGCFLAPQGQNTNEAVNANNTNQAVNTNQGGQGEIDTSDLPSEDLSQEGWKTYRNEEYGFEFRYPGELWISHEYDADPNKLKVSDNFYLGRFNFEVVKNGADVIEDSYSFNRFVDGENYTIWIHEYVPDSLEENDIELINRIIETIRFN